jgi:hypothetical protein
MLPTIITLLAIWLGLNVAFVTMRIYLTADRRPRDGRGAAEYPRLVTWPSRFSNR